MSLGQELVEGLVDRLVERGEQVQEAARKRVDAFRKNRRHLVWSSTQNVETALDTADLPSKADILSLQAQIATLSSKVDQLSEEKAKRTTQAQP